MWDLSSLARDRTRGPCIARRILYHWTPREDSSLCTIAVKCTHVMTYRDSNQCNCFPSPLLFVLPVALFALLLASTQGTRRSSLPSPLLRPQSAQAQPSTGSGRERICGPRIPSTGCLCPPFLRRTLPCHYPLVSGRALGVRAVIDPA